MNRSRVIFIAWATVMLYVLVAVCLTHMPKAPSELKDVGDKTLHTVGYFLYAATIYVAAFVTFPKRRGLPLYVMLTLALWAAADEITQPYFGRTADLLDWHADMVGVIVAVVLLGGLRLTAALLERRAFVGAPDGSPES